jgi:cation:H+ antiporter
MLDLIIWVLVFIASMITLIKASGYFINSAEKIGVALKISPFIVGVTIVALGTSLPELVSSIFAVIQGASEMVIGNVIGSNITNIFLILGIAAVLTKNKLTVDRGLIHVDLPLLFGSAVFLTIAVWDQKFTLVEAILALALATVYILSTVKLQHADTKTKREVKKRGKKRKVELKTGLILLLSGLLIVLAARYTVESVIHLSAILNIGTEIIAISAVALGTSLPELFVSVTAAKKGHAEMAIGNILGSNIFNALAVMGIPALIGDLTIPRSILTFGIPVMLIATLVYFFTTQDQEVTKWEGWMLLILYVLFMGKLFNLF